MGKKVSLFGVSCWDNGDGDGNGNGNGDGGWALRQAGRQAGQYLGKRRGGEKTACVLLPERELVGTNLYLTATKKNGSRAGLSPLKWKAERV